MEFPDEILEQILSKVPRHCLKKVDDVCKRFHHIIRDRPRRLVIRSKEIPFSKDKVKACEDEDFYQNIIHSQKKIFFVSLCLGRFTLSSNDVRFNRLLKIIETHGKNITSVLVRESEFTDGFFFTLLNLMPNLEVLKIVETKFADFEIPEDFQLQLHKLRNLNIQTDQEKVFEVFNRLPDNVLHELDIESKLTASNSKFFENQRNVKILTDNNNFLRFLSIDTFKLRKLTLTSTNLDFEGKLPGQDELVSLEVCGMDQEHFDYICNNLKSLEEFTMTPTRQHNYINMSQLDKLKKLRKFYVKSQEAFCSSLMSLKSESVDQLIFHYFDGYIRSNIACNCPNLKSLKVYACDFPISVILNGLPKLEEFSCKSYHIRNSEQIDRKDVRNDSLKHLHLHLLGSESGLLNLLSIVRCCKNLEKITISGDAVDRAREKGFNKKFKHVRSLFFFEKFREDNLETAFGFELERLFTEHLEVSKSSLELSYVLERKKTENINDTTMLKDHHKFVVQPFNARKKLKLNHI